MRLRLLVISAACAMTVSAAIVGVDCCASAATVNYDALGASYSSGTGTGSYDLDSTCQRSSRAYPAKWAAAHTTSSFKFVACSGAKTTDVLNNQLGSLGSSTSLVSITIGGND